MIEKIEKILSDCLDKLSDESQPVELKDKIISDIEKITISFIDSKKTLSDILDVINISKITDNNTIVRAPVVLDSILIELQKLIDSSIEFINTNKNK